ncbi:amino acid ABC transporter permease [Desulfovibrio psychrotolerans]|uniref:Glutamate/aspartate import permease protein GltK n=1 Tax=Desulfovibrio psychrotolerans TaxID=415242 RepID=A0A7J0BXC9_9BACT|nr:amino acid ABC transporter permease [Desulfovibrio psychrotolerans]GFM37644.1 amino acid ABC transporter permease [Desulfovibrio psychrotolerans]
MQWNIVADNFEYLLIGAYPEGPLGGLALTVVMAAISIFGAFWLGLIIGLMRLSKRWWLKWPSFVYIEIIRGIPLLMLILWVYFLFPVVMGKAMPENDSVIIAFVVFTAAYIAEIVRAGVLALPSGQMEASRATGLSKFQAMKYVILPQALRNMIPSFVNQFVSLTKDTSLAYIIGVAELTRAATQVNNRTLSAPMEIYLTILVMYFIICYVLTSFSRRLERKMARYQARG